MNVLDMLLNQQGSVQIEQLARNFGLDQAQAKSAVSELVPALSHGLKRNMSSEGGVESLVKVLQGGSHQKYVDNPEILANDEAKDDGNAILGHIFGSKDVSRAVAEKAAGNSGLDVGILKKMLPMVAGLVMGSLSKQSSSAGGLGGSAGSGGITDILGGFLDADKDGSVMDDLMGMAGKFFR